MPSECLDPWACLIPGHGVFEQHPPPVAVPQDCGAAAGPHVGASGTIGTGPVRQSEHRGSAWARLGHCVEAMAMEAAMD